MLCFALAQCLLNTSGHLTFSFRVLFDFPQVLLSILRKCLYASNPIIRFETKRFDFFCQINLDPGPVIWCSGFTPQGAQVTQTTQAVSRGPGRESRVASKVHKQCTFQLLTVCTHTCTHTKCEYIMIITQSYDYVCIIPLNRVLLNI